MTINWLDARIPDMIMRDAAQDMLAALKATQPALEAAMTRAQEAGNGPLVTLLQVTFATNRAAIAKAEGHGVTATRLPGRGR